MRLLALSLLLPSFLLAQDAAEIVRRASELDIKNVEMSRNYTYLRRQEQRQVDSNGRLKKLERVTYDVTILEGSPYARLVARDDKPLSAKEQQQEEDKLQKSIAERRKETKEQHDRRVAEWERKQEKQREPLKELPEAFDLKIVGEESVNGAEAWIIDGTPKPGYRPKSQSTSFFPKVKFRAWVEKQGYHWFKLDMESLDTISFGGLLVRMAKGSHLTVENARINNEVWLPKAAVLKGTIRIALVKVLRGEIRFTFSDYKKFSTNSRIVTQ